MFVYRDKDVNNEGEVPIDDNALEGAYLNDDDSDFNFLEPSPLDA
jgi:hypothetical protein